MLLDREEIEQADLIIGINSKTGDETVFYGRSLLMLIKDGYEGPGIDGRVVRVLVDFSEESDEPELLAAMCMAVKGSCDAPSYSDVP